MERGNKDIGLLLVVFTFSLVLFAFGLIIYLA